MTATLKGRRGLAKRAHQHVNAQRACEIAAAARVIHAGHQRGKRKPLLPRHGLQHRPEFRLQGHAGAMSRNGEGPLFQGFVPNGHFGWIMSSGLTRRSNSSAVTSPLFTASSRSVVPFLCADLAILAALS